MKTLIYALYLTFATQQYLVAAEIWVSGRQSLANYGTSTVGGTGTVEDPYYGDFDSIITNRSSGDVFYLLAGVYYTHGDTGAGTSKWKSSQLVRGSGKDITTIRLGNDIATNLTISRCVISGSTNGTGLQLSDLTLDVNTPTWASITNDFVQRNGAFLLGSNSKVKRVKVIKPYGTSMTNANYPFGCESFPTSLSGVSGNVAASLLEDGKEIEDCEVADVRGNYVTSYSLTGQGVVRNNSVVFPVLSSGQTGGGLGDPSARKFQAYSGAWLSNACFTANYAYGGHLGFSQDTGPLGNVTVANNVFRNVSGGITIIQGSDFSTNVFLTRNIIEINTSAPSLAAISLQAATPALIDTVYVSQNLIKPVGPTVSFAWLNVHDGGPGKGQVTNLWVAQNTVDTNMFLTFWCLSAHYDHDFELKGYAKYQDYVTETMPVSALEPSYYDVAAWPATNQLQRYQRLVIIKGTDASPKTLYLPAITAAGGWDWPGEEIILVNASSVTNNVYPALGTSDQIKPTGPIGIPPNSNAMKFIADDSGHWWLY